MISTDHINQNIVPESGSACSRLSIDCYRLVSVLNNRAVEVLNGELTLQYFSLKF